LEHRERWPVRVQCRVRRVHQSGYYRWLARGENGSRGEPPNRVLEAQIGALLQESKSRYGSPRWCRELRWRGVVVKRARVARLMREAGWQATGQRRFKATTNSQHHYPVAPNLLARHCSAAGGHQVSSAP